MRKRAEGREAILTPFCHAPAPSRPEDSLYVSRISNDARVDTRARHASPDTCFWSCCQWGLWGWSAGARLGWTGNFSYLFILFGSLRLY